MRWLTCYGLKVSDFSTFVKMPKKLWNYRYEPHNKYIIYNIIIYNNETVIFVIPSDLILDIGPVYIVSFICWVDKGPVVTRKVTARVGWSDLGWATENLWAVSMGRQYFCMSTVGPPNKNPCMSTSKNKDINNKSKQNYPNCQMQMMLLKPVLCYVESSSVS